MTASTTMQALGKRLQAARERMNMTQEDAAKRLNVERATYAHWEQGRSEMSASRLEDVCTLYGISADYLFGTKLPQNDDERELVGTFRMLPPELRESAKRLLKAFVDGTAGNR